MAKPVNPARAEYLKQWRKNHPEKISQYNRQYWERRLKREQEERRNKDGETSA